MRILLVEDDPVLQSVVQQSLQGHGHRVDAAGDLATAAHWWRVQPFDAVLLDLNLPLDPRPGAPMGSGLSLLRELRARGDRTPVLVLTARNRTDERIAGLDAGADDYLGKPFELAEVDARLRALVRRSKGADDRVQIGRLEFQRISRRVLVGGQALALPAREYEVLAELLSPPGRAVSKKDLADKLSDLQDPLADNALEAFVSRLRKKLVGSGVSIRTLRGLGYRIEDDTGPSPAA